MTKPFERKTYYAMTLDPVHVGTGGYRLGRVDNTITREPGTNIPKIPGSSLAGVTRAYTALAVQSEKPLRMKFQRQRAVEITKPDGAKEQKITYDSCAGKGGEDGDSHCGEPDCEVCVPFGFSKKGNNLKKGSNFQGLAQFFDARILFFPVHSMNGPVWVTCPSVLRDFKVVRIVDDKKFKAINNNEQVKRLNFGWLMLSQDDPNVEKIEFSAFPDSGGFCSDCNVILGRAYLVSDKLFSHIVNDNLEVRTSVAINPATGAAKEGALYTYEAIPRATVMWFDVVYNKPEYFKINGTEDIRHGKSNGNGWEWLEENVRKGLAYLKDLGVGGMNTRGMGRLKVFDIGG